MGPRARTRGRTGPLSRPGSVAGGWETCHVPRRTWLDSKTDVFLEELAASGMHLDRQRAGELITGQVRAVAALAGVTEATARSYLGDEAIKDMARRMLFEVAGERARRGPAGGAADRSAAADAGGDQRPGHGRCDAGPSGRRG